MLHRYNLPYIHSLIHQVQQLQHDGSIKNTSFRVKADRITQAATYIEDAIKIRKPQKRITEKGAISCLSPLKLPKTSLHIFQISNCVPHIFRAYQFCHSKSWKIFIFLIIWIHLLSLFNIVNEQRYFSPLVCMFLIPICMQAVNKH